MILKSKIWPQSSQSTQRVWRFKSFLRAFAVRRNACLPHFSVTSVFSDKTTSHSTKLAKGASQVAGYVANEAVEKPDFRKKSRCNLLIYKCVNFAF